ncbi:MAG: fumarylacetoacetate hydrolase family protein [Pseudomonadota bacterium]
MTYIFNSPPVSSLPIAGTDALFPIRRVFCVGRNYADHVVEMGGDPDREEPFFFCKPADAVIANASNIPFPPRTDDFHHEAELVIAIGEAGTNVAVDDALNHVFGYAAGVDLTRRDLQAEAKKRGRPWDMAKGFDCSAPISAIQPAGAIGHPEDGAIVLSVNGEIKQNGDLNQQVWKVPEIVANLSTYVTLAAGDLIMTGTPAGVGPLVPGDVVSCEIGNIGSVSFTITDRA